MLTHLLQQTITLFVVLDPIGLVLPFIALTRQETSAGRRSIALICVVVAGGILMAFMVVGQVLLDLMGVSIASLQIAGGLLLLLVGIKMVMGEVNDQGPEPAEESDIELAESFQATGVEASVAVFPLAMPLLAGPGAITTVILLTDKTQYTPFEQVETLGIMIGVLGFTYLALMLADRIQHYLGPVGVTVITRILGLILAAFAVEMILKGFSDYLANWV